MSRFDLEVGYVARKENGIADILSRWAYPASEALKDLSKHGNKYAKKEMQNLIKEEKEDEKKCLFIQEKQPVEEKNNPPAERVKDAPRDPKGETRQLELPVWVPIQPLAGTAQSVRATLTGPSQCPRWSPGQRWSPMLTARYRMLG